MSGLDWIGLGIDWTSLFTCLVFTALRHCASHVPLARLRGDDGGSSTLALLYHFFLFAYIRLFNLRTIPPYSKGKEKFNRKRWDDAARAEKEYEGFLGLVRGCNFTSSMKFFQIRFLPMSILLI